MKLVRLKTYDQRRGNVLRSYTAFGSRFLEGRGWYQVDDSVADYLATVRQPPTGNYQADDAPFAFEIATAQEAAALDAEEARKRAALAGTASAPLPTNVTPIRAHNVSREAAQAAAGTLTTADLPRASKAAEVDALPDTFDDDMAAEAPPPPPPPPPPAATGGRRKRS